MFTQTFVVLAVDSVENFTSDKYVSDKTKQYNQCFKKFMMK